MKIRNIIIGALLLAATVTGAHANQHFQNTSRAVFSQSEAQPQNVLFGFFGHKHYKYGKGKQSRSYFNNKYYHNGYYGNHYKPHYYGHRWH